jgi:hypothetical protein
MYFDAFLTHLHLAWFSKPHPSPNICWLGSQLIKDLVLEFTTSPHYSIGIVPSCLSRSEDVTTSNSKFVSLPIRSRHFDASRNDVSAPISMWMSHILHPPQLRIQKRQVLTFFSFLRSFLPVNLQGYICFKSGIPTRRMCLAVLQNLVFFLNSWKMLHMKTAGFYTITIQTMH